MEALITDLLYNTRMGTREEIMLVLLLTFLPLLFFFTFRARAGRSVPLRPIPGYALLKELLGRALETGQSLHLSMGTAGIGGRTTAETLAGLMVLEHLVDQAAVGHVSPLITVADPTLLPVAQDVVRRGRNGTLSAPGKPAGQDTGEAPTVSTSTALSRSSVEGSTDASAELPNQAPREKRDETPPSTGAGLQQSQGVSDSIAEKRGPLETHDPARVRLIAPQPVAYAAGVMDLLEREDLAANVMIGSFGDEFLLMGEMGAKKRLTQIGGAVDPRTLPFIFASMDHALLGEEIFAAGAYLSGRPAHIGSLRTQDWIRWLIVAAIVGGVAWKTLGLP